MTDQNSASPSLRQRAVGSVGWSRFDISRMSPEEIQQVVDELRIHQVELEMQNDELRNTQHALAEARDRLIDLYDFAPVGYVSLSADGVIMEANLAAAELLGVDRAKLSGTNINCFLLPDCRDDAWQHRRRVLSADCRQAVELRMVTADGRPLVVRLESIAGGSDDNQLCRTALIDVTTVKRAQQLQESESRFRVLNATLERQTKEVRLLAEAMSSLAEGVMITSDATDWPNPKIVYVNKALSAITGYPAEELIGQSPRLLQGSLTDKSILRELRQALKKGAPHRCEVINYRKDGTAYDAEIFVCPLYDATGRHTNFVGIHRDISDRVSTERRLRSNEERLRAILSTASDAIVIIDAQGIIDDVNPATVRMFGYHRSEMIGQNVSMLMPSPYREEHDGYISRYMETGDARIIGKGREVVGRRRDGSVFPVDLAVSEVDHMGLFTGAIRDLSERHKVQEELRREQDLTANIVNTVQSIVLLLNPQGHIIHFNPYMTRLTGWSLEDVQGRNWFEIFVRPADRSDIEILFNQAVAGMSTRGNVSVILTRDGREREIEWYDAPLTDADGKLIGLLCSGQDVTENRQLARHVLNAATEEQRRIGQDLHDSVGQEVAGLTMMADALTRAMNENSTWLDERGIDVPGRAGHVRIVEQLSSGLHNALRQLKAVARGLHPVEVDPLGLHSALHELADHVSSLYGMVCEFHGDSQILIRSKDMATHLYRIAQEAVTNAVVHGKAQHVTVSLQRRNGTVSLAIRDDGKGLPADAECRGGMGLQSMRYRAGLIGGRLTIAPGTGAGTLVACEFRE
ncbi:MAG: PAS domain S-box protein [Planctomycetaceae bacterium]